MSSLLSREEAALQPLVALNLRDVEERAREAVERARVEARRMLTEGVARAREEGIATLKEVRKAMNMDHGLD